MSRTDEASTSGGESVVYAAWHYWNIAVAAAAQTKILKEEDPAVCTADTLVATVLSAFTTEAFINELGDALARLVPNGHEELEDLRATGHLLTELEKDHAQVTAKYLLSGERLPGPAFDPGATLFQDFSLLIALRNSLAHPRAQREPPSFYAFFESKGWTYDAKGKKPKLEGWVFQLETPEVACWACQAAAKIVANIVSRLEESPSAAQHIWNRLNHQWKGALSDKRMAIASSH